MGAIWLSWFQLEACKYEVIVETKRPHQVSLLILHPRRPDQVVLLSPPVSEAAEEVVGEEAADGVPDYVDVDGLLDTEPSRRRQKSKRSELQLPPAPMWRCRSPGEVQEVDVARVEEGLRDPADVPNEIHLQNQKWVSRSSVRSTSMPSKGQTFSFPC